MLSNKFLAGLILAINSNVESQSENLEVNKRIFDEFGLNHPVCAVLGIFISSRFRLDIADLYCNQQHWVLAAQYTPEKQGKLEMESQDEKNWN